MHRILLALATLFCLPLVTRAGWDVEFELGTEFAATSDSVGESPAEAANPLVISWSMKGVEEDVVASFIFENYCRTTPPFKSIYNDPEKSADRAALIKELWPGTRSYLQWIDDDVKGR